MNEILLQTNEVWLLSLEEISANTQEVPYILKLVGFLAI
jgi:hypothetical protein